MTIRPLLAPGFHPPARRARPAGWLQPSCPLAQEELPELVVTATRVPIPLEQSGSAITVIDREELEQRQIRIVADALRDVPGATVSRSGGPGNLTEIYLRGAETNPNPGADRRRGSESP